MCHHATVRKEGALTRLRPTAPAIGLSACLSLFLLAGCAASSEEAEPAATSPAASQALAPNPLPANQVAANPYLSASEGLIHNDCYSSDVTDAVLPLDIDSSVSLSVETRNVTAPSAAFYDERGNAISPLLGGISISRFDGDTIERLGSFVPSLHDGGGYSVQISYSFVDADGNVVMPTTDGRILCVRTTDDEGNVLPVFEKVFDIDVVSQAKAALGDDIDPNILSIIYDYEGNLWFVTGGFRIYPDRNPAGFVGYISREYLNALSQGAEASVEDGVRFLRLAEGEGAENGISSCEEGAVILTNMACYLLDADDGVKTAWRVPYETNGANDAVEGSGYEGGGLSYGSGITPTLTSELVLFTDNLDPVNLYAVSIATGEVVATIPVLDGLGEDTPVSIENSILVYDCGQGTTSVVLANWFGAGNAGLADPDADSSIQSYDNIYDAKWREEGNGCIAPGLERVDIVKGEDGYTASSVWARDNVSSTMMAKLSTATGYLYGYWQDDSGTWCYTVLDFDTGDTLVEKPVSSLPEYNNVAVGLIPDAKGNALYCPTNALEMARWQDNFAYLPEIGAKAISPNVTSHFHVTDDALAERAGQEASAASFLMEAAIGHVPESETVVAFKVNGLAGKASELRLFAERADGSLAEFGGSWAITDAEGNPVDDGTELAADELYELRATVVDGSEFDLDEAESAVRIGVVLAR